MIARTELGVVVSRKGDRYILLLKAGNRIKVVLKKSPLKRGSKCHVSFNNASGKVVNVLTYDENSCDIDTMEFSEPYEELTEKEIEAIDNVEEGECSRRQKDEDWEHTELELWSSGVFSEDRSLRG